MVGVDREHEANRPYTFHTTRYLLDHSTPLDTLLGPGGPLPVTLCTKGTHLLQVLYLQIPYLYTPPTHGPLP